MWINNKFMKLLIIQEATDEPSILATKKFTNLNGHKKLLKEKMDKIGNYQKGPFSFSFKRKI